MSLKVVGTGDSFQFVKDESKPYVDPAPTENSKGGTEMMLQGLKDRIDPDLLDQFQIITSRIRNLKKKPKILWLHDTHDDYENTHLSDPKSRARFEKLVFVSNWQQQLFQLQHGIDPSECLVMKNAIDPIPAHKKSQEGPIHIIYHTTPHRGLALLSASFAAITKEFPDLDIQLDVYSSFEIYGWGSKDVQFKELFDELRSQPNVNYHGYQENDVVRQALQKAHIFALPSIWPETSCISMIEAMSAGCLCVTNNFGALSETCANWAMMYPYHEDVNQHVNLFANTLAGGIHRIWDEGLQNQLQFQKMYFDKFYNWDLRTAEWTALLRGLLENSKND